MSVNIGEANAGDAFYRYKMPKLQARIEGRGNGIKTNVVNNVEIAKALERPPEYIVKYYGCQLGAVTKFEKASGTSIVNGAHDVSKLTELLEGFIKTFVQCYSCGNPETQVKVKKDSIHLKCKACGAISDVDMRHKLNTFILKNPPEEKISKAEKRLRKMEKERLKEAAGENLDKEEKKKKKKDKDKKKKSGEANGDAEEQSPEEQDDDEEEEGGDVVWMTDTSAEAARKRAEEQLSEAMAGMVTQGNIEAEQKEARRREKEEKRRAEEEAAAEAAAAEEKRKAEEAAAAAAAAEEKRKAEEAAAAAKAEEERRAAEQRAANGNAEANGTSAAMSDAVDSMRRVLEKTKSAAKVSHAVRGLEVEGGPSGKMRALYQAMFAEDTETPLANQITKRKLILHSLADDAASQVAQLLALEYLLGVADTDRRSQAPFALKALYDEDIIEEDMIIAWYNKPTAGKVLGIPTAAAKAVREAATKFVEWLQEADEDESEEEDSMDEEDI
jgi:translation initiation factor 5